MRRRLFLTCAVAWILMLAATPAYAGFWSWLEEYSGPGPFTSNTPFYYFTVCGRGQSIATTGALGPIFIGLPPGGDVPWCLYYDEAHRSAPPARGFAGVEVTTRDIGASVPLGSGVFTLGAGLGGVWISNDRTSNEEKRWTFTPFRLESRPLLFVPALRSRDNFWKHLAGSFKVYIKETAILGEPISADDFGGIVPVPGEPTAVFDQTPRGELVRSYGWVIDLTDVTSWFVNR